MCRRASALRSSYSVRRRTTSRRNSTKLSINSTSDSTFGRPPTIASMMTPKLLCSAVCLYRLLRITSPTSPRFKFMTMLMPARSAWVRGVVGHVVQAPPPTLPALQIDDDAHARAIGLVADVGDAFEGLLA